VIWDLGAATVGEAMEAINARRGQALARGTVQVQLRRLKEKGWLQEVRRSGSKLAYTPTCDRTVASADIASDFTTRVFDGSCAELVRCLYQEDKLTPEEIGRLRELIGQMEPGGATRSPVEP
jgi:predicted transcriptional regulator